MRQRRWRRARGARARAGAAAARAPTLAAASSAPAPDTTWWPAGNWTPNYPIIDFTADFHVFGVEINDTAIRWYVDNATNTIMTISAPPLCVDEPGFVWGKSMYMPWKPMYGILNTAVNKANANLEWWAANNATTLVDWVRFYEFVAAEAEVRPDKI